MNVERIDEGVFASLEKRLSNLEPKVSLGLGRDRWILAIMVLGLAMVSTSKLWDSGLFPWLSIGGLVLELCAFGVFTYRQFRDLVPEFVDAKRKYARELDCHFDRYEDVRSWLRTLPPDVVEKRLNYLETRLESVGQRFPIFFGATDRLGVLPVLVGVFIQLAALNDVSPLMGFFAAFVIILYCMALWMSRFRLQLQGYVRLLKSVV